MFVISIEIDNLKIDERQCFASITAKYGKEYFGKTSYKIL